MYEEQYLIQIIKYLLNSDGVTNSLLIPQKDLDWSRLIKIADRHNVGGLLYHALPEILEERKIPEELAEEMQRKAMCAVLIDVRQQVAKEELLSRFEEKKIYCMPVKGVNTKEYYPRSELRTMGDLDILYKPEQHKEVKGLLQEMGYMNFESGLKHDHYSKKPFITLEMHRSLVAANTTAESYYEDVWEKAQPREGYHYVYQMSLEEQYIYTMVHLMEHFKNGGIGIRFVMDVFVFNKLKKLDRQYVKDKFEELRMLKFVFYIEQLAQKWFGNQNNAIIEEEAEDVLHELEKFIMTNGLYGNVSHAQDAVIVREGHKRYLMRVAFPDYHSMVSLYPWLEKKKYLLPFGWGIRIVRTVLFRRNSIKTGINTLKYGSSQRGKALLEFYKKCGIENAEEDIKEECIEKNSSNFMQMLKSVIQCSELERIPALHEPIDWNALEDIAQRHNLFPLFHEVACQFPEYRNGKDYEDNVNLVMTIVSQQIKKRESFLDLYRTFLKEDLHPIVMKGIICRQLYGKYAEKRPSGDEDILVRKEDFYRVKAIMESKGYVCSMPDVTLAQLDQLQDVGFYDNKMEFLIEVHTNIMGHTNEMRTKMGNCFQDVFSHTRTVMIQDIPVTTMSHTEHFMFLVLHAFKHFSLSGVGIRQMLDILLYQRAYEQEIDWERVKVVLTDNHATGYLGDLQYIGEQYLGFELEERFEICSPEALLKDMMEVGVFGKKGDADILAARINLQATKQGKVGLLAWVRMGFPAVRYMINDAPYLKEKPWLLPIEWGKRWGRFFKRARRHEGNIMLDSMRKSRERMEFLKKYGL